MKAGRHSPRNLREAPVDESQYGCTRENLAGVSPIDFSVYVGRIKSKSKLTGSVHTSSRPLREVTGVLYVRSRLRDVAVARRSL